jgi:hypothetical protein
LTSFSAESPKGDALRRRWPPSLRSLQASPRGKDIPDPRHPAGQRDSHEARQSELSVRSARSEPVRRALTPCGQARTEWWAGTGLNHRHQDSKAQVPSPDSDGIQTIPVVNRRPWDRQRACGWASETDRDACFGPSSREGRQGSVMESRRSFLWIIPPFTHALYRSPSLPASLSDSTSSSP